MGIDSDHILLTRFNLPSPGAESAIRSRPAWLEDRVELFERFCLPSVDRQDTRDFHWLIYFDPQSPTWLKDWIAQVHAGRFTPAFRAQVSREELLADLDELVPNKRARLITTNLDNDDGLSTDFVSTLRELPTTAERQAIYLSQGLILSPSGLYLRRDRHNAFCSVSESWERPVTCWADWHNRLHLSMPTNIVSGEPHWLQVVHQTNVSNRVRGKLVSPLAYADRFPDLRQLTAPSKSEIRRDRFVLGPGRFLRNSVRSTIRRSAVAVLGKERTDRAKASLAGIRRSRAQAVPEVDETSEHGFEREQF